jgi:hypothetical protein
VDVTHSGSKGTPATMAASNVAASMSSNGSSESVFHKVWSLDNVPRGMLRTDLPRLSKCEIEIDARCKGTYVIAPLISQRRNNRVWMRLYTDIANLRELRSQRLHPSAQADVKLVKSLASMWEVWLTRLLFLFLPLFGSTQWLRGLFVSRQEDRMRRVAQGKPSQASPVVTPERADIPHFPMTEDALRAFERIISQDKVRFSRFLRAR